MRASVLALLFFFLIISGCLSARNDRPDWINQVKWEGDFKPDPKIETLLWEQVIPYPSAEYEEIIIKTGRNGDVLNLRVTGRSNMSPYVDIYELIYEKNELLMTGYLLEAVPQSQRSKAVMIASREAEISQSIIGTAEEPTVKRILPETSSKYYQPKILLSVTWQGAGVSALVDLDTSSVVKTWKKDGGTQ